MLVFGEVGRACDAILLWPQMEALQPRASSMSDGGSVASERSGRPPSRRGSGRSIA